MALDLTTVGTGIGPLRYRYDQRDVMLYGLAVGAGRDSLQYCYEKNLKVLPTFALATTFDFFWELARITNIDIKGILHGEQELIFHRPLALTDTLVTDGQVAGFIDKGADRGALVSGDARINSAAGELLVSGRYTLFARLDGGLGEVVEPPPPTAAGGGAWKSWDDFKPTIEIETATAPDQHLLYRLTGDYFAVHVDPEFARAAGFTGPIMHGACTLGYACRVMVDCLMAGEPARLKRLACRFAGYVYPGTDLRIQIESGLPGQVRWRVRSALDDRLLIDRGECEFVMGG